MNLSDDKKNRDKRLARGRILAQAPGPPERVPGRRRSERATATMRRHSFRWARRRAPAGMMAASAADPGSQYYFAPGVTGLICVVYNSAARFGGVFGGSAALAQRGKRRAGGSPTSGSRRNERVVTSGGSNATQGVCPTQDEGDAPPGSQHYFAPALSQLISECCAGDAARETRFLGSASPACQR